MKYEVLKKYSITVQGTPYPKMEARADLNRWRKGQEERPYITKSYSETLMNWVRKVEQSTRRVMIENCIKRRDIHYARIQVVFYIPRPLDQFRPAMVVKPALKLTAPTQRNTDVTMLGRAIHTTLSGMFWEYRTNVVSVQYDKEWTSSHEGRAEISIEAIRYVDESQPELGL